jgi:hypothetical protein
MSGNVERGLHVVELMYACDTLIRELREQYKKEMGDASTMPLPDKDDADL